MSNPNGSSTSTASQSAKTTPIFDISDTSDTMNMRRALVNTSSHSKMAYDSESSEEDIDNEPEDTNKFMRFVHDMNAAVDKSDNFDVPPQHPLKHQMTHAIANMINNQVDFWKYIDSLHWTDRSDAPIALAIMLAKLRTDMNNADIERFRQFLSEAMLALRAKFIDLLKMPPFNGPNGTQCEQAFLSHIVAKGQIFYAMAMEDPGFATYLAIDTTPPEYQSLYAALPLTQPKN